MIAAAFNVRAARVEHTVDYLGAVLLAGSLSSIVLFTSLGGNTYAWASAPIVVMAVLGPVLLVAFCFAEQRAVEPILPLALFRNRIFTVTSAIGFIIGLALFGSITYLPLFLQIVRSKGATASGLQLTPMMGGLLITSIVSGQLISRFGRYRPFPIVGTALVTVAMVLLTGLNIHSTTLSTSLYLVVLGLGLGMVMQVLVIAVQNAVDYKYLGVATSGSVLFRQVGGSIGIAIFGAIFANRLKTNLAHSLPPGTHAPSSPTPKLVKHLPPAVHEKYITAFSSALHPVFVVAAFAGGLSFLLTWLLREVPLRKTTGEQPVPVEAMEVA